MDEASGFAHNLARLRGKDEAEAFLRSALAALETYGEPAEEQDQRLPELPFELVENTLMKFAAVDELCTSLHVDVFTAAKLEAAMSATRQGLSHLFTAAAVCLQWRHAASRAAGELQCQCAAMMSFYNHHSHLVSANSDAGKDNHCLMLGLFAMKSFNETNLRWFRKHGAGWELRNKLHVPDDRFIARIGEFALLETLEEGAKRTPSQQRVSKLMRDHVDSKR